MNQEADRRVDRARDKVAVLQALFHGWKDNGDDLGDLISLPLVFGLDEIIKGIKHDLNSADNGGYPVELCEYSLEALEREIESRKKAPEPQPASEDSEADR